jgi:hypothetical protein
MNLETVVLLPGIMEVRISNLALKTGSDDRNFTRASQENPCIIGKGKYIHGQAMKEYGGVEVDLHLLLTSKFK